MPENISREIVAGINAYDTNAVNFNMIKWTVQKESPLEKEGFINLTEKKFEFLMISFCGNELPVHVF